MFCHGSHADAACTTARSGLQPPFRAGVPGIPSGFPGFASSAWVPLSNPSSFRSSRRLAQAAGPCIARIARAPARVCAGAVRAPDCACARVNQASAGHTSPVSFSGVFSRRRRRERRSGSRDAASLPPAPFSHGLPGGQPLAGIISPFYEQTMKFNHAFPQLPARISSAAFSPIMMEGALVLPEVRVGMIEASATRRPSMPWTRSRSSTTAIGSEPILQVPTGW